MHATQYVLRTCAAFKWSNTLLLNLKMTAGEFMPRAGLQILLESMSLVQCRKSNICLKRPGRILGRRKTPIPRVMVAKPPLQIRGRSDITLLRIVYRSKNVCVEHSIIIPQKPSAALLRVSLETATEGILRSLLPSRPLFEDGVPSVADLLRKSRRMVGARGFEPPTFCSQSIVFNLIFPKVYRLFFV